MQLLEEYQAFADKWIKDISYQHKFILEFANNWISIHKKYLKYFENNTYHDNTKDFSDPINTLLMKRKRMLSGITQYINNRRDIDLDKFYAALMQHDHYLQNLIKELTIALRKELTQINTSHKVISAYKQTHQTSYLTY